MPIFLFLFALLLAGCNPFGPSSIDPTFGINTDSEVDPESEAISVSVTTTPADGSLVRTSNCTPVELEVPTPASAELKLDVSLALYDGTEVEGLFADSACTAGADSHQEITIVAGQRTATAYARVDSPGSYRVSAAAAVATDAYDAGYADFNADTFSVQMVSSEAAYYFEECFAVDLSFLPSGITHAATVVLSAGYSSFYESSSDCESESNAVTATTSSRVWVRIPPTLPASTSETLSPSAAGYLTVATSILGITGPRPQLELALGGPSHSRTGWCNEVELSVSSAPSAATSIDIAVVGATGVIYPDATCTTPLAGNLVALAAGALNTSFYVTSLDEELVQLTAYRAAADYRSSNTVEIEFYDPELSWSGLDASMPAYVCTEATVSVYDPGVSASLSLSLNRSNIGVYNTLSHCQAGTPAIAAISLSARDGGAGSSATVYVKGTGAAATLLTDAGFAAVTHNIAFYNLLDTLSLSSSRITDVQRLDLGAVVSYYVVGDFSTAAAGMPNGLRRIDLTGANLSPHIDLRRTSSAINTVTAADITSTAIVVGGTKSDATAMAAIYTDSSYREDSIGAGISLARVNAVGTVGYWAFAPGFTGARGAWGTAATALGLSDWETNLLLSNGKQIVVEDSTEAAAVLKSSGERESTAGVFSSMIRLSDGKYLAALYDDADGTFSIALSDDLTNSSSNLATPDGLYGMSGKVTKMYQIDSDQVLLAVEEIGFYRWTRSGASHAVAAITESLIGFDVDTELHAITPGPGYSECEIILAGKNFYKSFAPVAKYARDFLCANRNLKVYQGHADAATP